MGLEHPDWLPVGWRVTVKARNSGKKDKYYINLLNGRKFNSKPEVLRYLKGSGKDLRPMDPVKIDVKKVKKAVADKLPPGWIKEIRTKRKHGKTRRDPTYIDPVSGRHFRSMQEVFRYLESKDPGRARSKPDATKSTHHLQSSSTEAKGQRSIDKKAEERAKSGVQTRPKPTMKIVNIPEGTRAEQKEVSLAIEFSDKLQKVKQRANKLRELKYLADNKVVAKLANENQFRTPKSSAVNEEQCNHGRRQSARLANIKLKDNVTKSHSLQSGSKGPAEKNINELQHQRENLKRKWACDMPRRTSRRLACAEVNPSLEAKAKTSNEAVSNTKSISKAGPSDEPEIDIKGKSSGSNGSKELPPECRTENPTDDQQKQPVTLGEQKSVGFEHATEEKHPGPTLENLLMDPCIEFAIKTLTGAIPIEYATKVGSKPETSLAWRSQTLASPSMLSSSVNRWTDPCFEFAVKTLKSDTPAQFQITFQQPFCGGYDSPTVPNFRSDNL